VSVRMSQLKRQASWSSSTRSGAWTQATEGPANTASSRAGEEVGGELLGDGVEVAGEDGVGR